MRTFKEFLKEDYLIEEEELLLEMAAASAEAASDDKGKMHELLLAKYLHPETKLPEHHRSESENPDHAGTPEQVHERLKHQIGPGAYKEIDMHAKQTAQAIKQHLTDNGHINNAQGHHIGNVFWTSNADKANTAGDHEKTTGVKDVNSNADLIVRIHDKNGKTVGHHGVSAKYGSQEPNYRNPGLDSLEKMSGLPTGTFAKHMTEHKARMDNLHYSGSADNRNYQTKIDEMAASGGYGAVRDEWEKHERTLAQGGKLKPKDKLMHANATDFIKAHDGLPKKSQDEFIRKAAWRASEARNSNVHARKQIAKEFHGALTKKSPEELAEIIRSSVSPQTHIPHIVAHSKVKDDGSAESIVKPMHNLADDHLSQFDLSTLSPHVGAGTSVTIKAKHLKTGKMTNVGLMNIKSSSGAHKGAVGTFKLKS